MSNDLFNILLNNPDKRAKVFELLTQEGLVSENGNSPIKRLQKKNILRKESPKTIKPNQNVRLESPSALHRRRALQKMESDSSTDEVISEKKDASAFEGPAVPFNQLLSGVVAYCEVHSNNGNRSEVVKAMVKAMGATVSDTFTGAITHVVFKDGSFSTFQKAKLLQVHLVSVLWLEAVKRHKHRVSESKYPALGVESYDANVSAICHEMLEEYDDIIQDEYRKRSGEKKPCNYITERRQGKSSAPLNRSASKSLRFDVTPAKIHIYGNSSLDESESFASASESKSPDSDIIPCSQDGRASLASNQQFSVYLPNSTNDESQEHLKNNQSNLAKNVKDSFEIKQSLNVRSPESLRKNKLSTNSKNSNSNSDDNSFHLHLTTTDESNANSLINRTSNSSRSDTNVGNDKRNLIGNRRLTRKSVLLKNIDKHVDDNDKDQISDPVANSAIINDNYSSLSVKAKKLRQSKLWSKSSEESIETNIEIMSDSSSIHGQPIDEPNLFINTRKKRQSRLIQQNIEENEKDTNINSAHEVEKPSTPINPKRRQSRFTTKKVTASITSDDTENKVESEEKIKPRSRKSYKSDDNVKDNAIENNINTKRRQSKFVPKDIAVDFSEIDIENNVNTKRRQSRFVAKNIALNSSRTTDSVEEENNVKEIENNVNTKRRKSRFVAKNVTPDSSKTTDGIEKENNREEVENNTKRRQSRFVPPDSSKTTDSVENKTGSDEKNKPRVRKLYRPDENIDKIFNWDDQPIKEKNIEITDEGEGKKSKKKFKVDFPKGFTIPKTYSAKARNVTSRRVSNITKRGRKSVCALNFNETAPLKTSSNTDLETKNSKTEISNERNVTEIRKDNSPTISPLKRTRKISSESNLTDIAEISETSKSHISNLSEVNPSKRIKNVLSETNPEKNDGDKIEPVSRTRKSIRLHPPKTKNTENESEKSDNEETEPKTPIKSVQKSRRQSEAPAKLLKNKILGTSPWESIPTKTVRRSTLDFVSRESLERMKSTQKEKQVSNKLRSIVCTRFHRADTQVFQQIVKKLGGFVVEDEVTQRTTHVVAGALSRTINILRGIARGCWILKSEWLYKSLEAGTWLQEEEYEMTEFSPAVQQCRIEKQSFGNLFCMDIFKNCGPIHVARDSMPRFSDLEELIELCGGTVVKLPRQAKIVIGEIVKYEDTICVNEKWILDSVTNRKRKNFKCYVY